MYIPTFLVIDTYEQVFISLVSIWKYRHGPGLRFNSHLGCRCLPGLTNFSWVILLSAGEPTLRLQLVPFSTNQYPPSVVTWKVFQPPSKTVCLENLYMTFLNQPVDKNYVRCILLIKICNIQELVSLSRNFTSNYAVYRLQLTAIIQCSLQPVSWNQFSIRINKSM